MEKENPPRARCLGPWRAMSKGATFESESNLAEEPSDACPVGLQNRCQQGFKIDANQQQLWVFTPPLSEREFYCSYFASVPLLYIRYANVGGGGGSNLCFQSMYHWTIPWTLCSRLQYPTHVPSALPLKHIGKLPTASPVFLCMKAFSDTRSLLCHLHSRPEGERIYDLRKKPLNNDDSGIGVQKLLCACPLGGIFCPGSQNFPSGINLPSPQW